MEEKCRSRELLIFIPLPFLTHLVPAVELASQLIHRRPNLSVVFMLLHQPFDPKAHSYAKSISSKSSADLALQFIHLPEPEPESDPDPTPVTPAQSFTQLLQAQTPILQKSVADIMSSNSTTKLSGFVIDIFCTNIIDVANAYNAPTYSLYIILAGSLVTYYTHTLMEDSGKGLPDYGDSDLDSDVVSIPIYENPVPVKMLTTSFFQKKGLSWLVHHVRRLRETKGIMVNTFPGFEDKAVDFLSNDPTLPTIYPVGPLINFKGIKNQNGHRDEETMEIVKWLDEQPASSVVLLSFGSSGSFAKSQVKEIANALEHCGCRFIWSLRLRENENEQNYDEVLPRGFLQRTARIGVVAPWVPQLRVLSHPSTGGFVTHCGASSVMEAVYCGVPMAVWPMHTDQQLTALMLVKELKIGVDIKMDYRLDFNNPNPDIVKADRIERGIRELMDVEDGSNVREKVKEMKEKARLSLLEGGSSCISIESLIEAIFKTN